MFMSNSTHTMWDHHLYVICLDLHMPGVMTRVNNSLSAERQKILHHSLSLCFIEAEVELRILLRVIFCKKQGEWSRKEQEKKISKAVSQLDTSFFFFFQFHTEVLKFKWRHWCSPNLRQEAVLLNTHSHWTRSAYKRLESGGRKTELWVAISQHLE